MSLLSEIFKCHKGDLLIRLKGHAAALGIEVDIDPAELIRTAFIGFHKNCPEDTNGRRDWQVYGEIVMLVQAYRSEVFLDLIEGRFVARGIRSDGVAMLIPHDSWLEVEGVDVLQNEVIFAGGQTFRELEIKENFISRTGGRTGKPGRPSDLTLPFVKKFQELEAAEGSLAVNTSTARRLILLVRSEGYSGKIPTVRGIIKSILRFKALESEA